MIQSATALIWLNFLLLQTTACSQDFDTKDHPVDLLEMKHVVIRNYNGPLHLETMNLLQNIESLEFKNSNFSPIADDFFMPLKNLKKFVATDSYVYRINKDISTCCKKLKYVDIHNVEFNKVPMHHVGIFPVERLSIRNEPLHKLEKESLKSPNMKYLKLENCHIESIEEGAFSMVDKLEEINLENNDIKTITKEILAPLKNVKLIDLRHNKLEKLTTDMFPSLPNLERLDVGHNPIKEINLEGLKELAPKLTKVDISGIELDISKSGGIDLVKTGVQ